MNSLEKQLNNIRNIIRSFYISELEAGKMKEVVPMYYLVSCADPTAGDSGYQVRPLELKIISPQGNNSYNLFEVLSAEYDNLVAVFHFRACKRSYFPQGIPKDPEELKRFKERMYTDRDHNISTPLLLCVDYKGDGTKVAYMSESEIKNGGWKFEEEELLPDSKVVDMSF